MAIPKEDDREKARGHWTLKSPAITPEVQNAIRLAAAREKRLIGDWCVEVLYGRAREVLGRPVEKPQPPARPEDLMIERLDQLWERQQADMAERDARSREEREQRERQLREESAAALRASEQRMQEMIAGSLKGIAQESRRGRWRR